jgi:hypothetical protein
LRRHPNPFAEIKLFHGRVNGLPAHRQDLPLGGRWIDEIVGLVVILARQEADVVIFVERVEKVQRFFLRVGPQPNFDLRPRFHIQFKRC